MTLIENKGNSFNPKSEKRMQKSSIFEIWGFWMFVNTAPFYSTRDIHPSFIKKSVMLGRELHTKPIIILCCYLGHHYNDTNNLFLFTSLETNLEEQNLFSCLEIWDFILKKNVTRANIKEQKRMESRRIMEKFCLLFISF